MAADNILSIPSPRVIRPAAEPLGLYVRAGRNDHLELLDLLAAGDANCFGLVFDPVNVARHKELREAATKRNLEAILDPKTQQAGTVGGHTPAIGALPWGLPRPHRVDDFKGAHGRERVSKIAQFTIDHGFTEVLSPTHLLSDAADPWLAVDVESTSLLRRELDARGGRNVGVIYSLAIPYSMFRDSSARRALARQLKEVQVDAIWLKIDGLGSSATSAGALNYINASAEFKQLGVPVVGDHVGGLVGLGLLAFGAVGGLAHGITENERFSASSWRRPRQPDQRGGSIGRRVYFRDLDLMLPIENAKQLLASQRALCGCRNPQCCPRGVQDMLENPARHFLYQRMQDVRRISNVPETLRPQKYLEEILRPATDRMVKASNANLDDVDLLGKLKENRKRLDSLRIAFGSYQEKYSEQSFARVPMRRMVREHRVGH